jgi:hypothetical protein
VAVQTNLAGARYMLIRTLGFRDGDSVETWYKTRDDHMKDVANTGLEWKSEDGFAGGRAGESLILGREMAGNIKGREQTARNVYDEELDTLSDWTVGRGLGGEIQRRRL